jgi:thymidylate synthase (FAD)
VRRLRREGDEVKVTLFDHNGSDRHVAAYFWTSTDKDADAFTCPESEVERVLRFGMKAAPVPHATPFGHPHVTVHVTDVPLFVVHQWQRHRVQNYSEKSHRYTSADAGFYIPDIADVRMQEGRPGHYRFRPLDPDNAKQVIAAMGRLYDEAWRRYDTMVAYGVANELARAVLPSGLLTQMYATASLRNWLGFLVQRNDEHAQLEIRRCAEQVEAILHDLYPITMRLWVEYGRRAV